MAQDTSSAIEEADEWIKGVGMRPLGCEDVDGLIRVNSAFVRSYVVKKAPAVFRQCPASTALSSRRGQSGWDSHEGSVAMMTLPMP